MKKTISTVLMILTAVAAIAGVIYIAATYGDRIVAWAKKLLKKLSRNDFCCYEDCYCDDEDCCCDCEEAADANEADFAN